MAQIKDLLVLGKSTFLDSIKFNKQVDIFGNAASMPLRVRGIVGSSGEGVTGDLYLQYGANSKVMLGNSGGYYISAAGDYYSGKSANATNADYATVAGKISDLTTNDNASSSEVQRRIWFAYSNNTTGRPAYDDRFTIQTSTGTLFAPIFSGNLSGNATTATSADALASTGYGNDNFTWFQGSGEFAGNSGWTSYLVSNHGDGSNYYHQIIAMPFWSAPKYRRMEGNTSTTKGWYDFITDENYTTKLDARYYTETEADDRFVNSTGDSMTGTLSWGGNISSLNFRTGHASYDGVISYQTSGNEAMLFTTKNAVTSFMFVNGEDTISNMAADRWTKVTPGLQIKNNCVAIGKLIANDSTPSYKLEVAGDIYANGGWVRVSGNQGLYFETHGGGWYMVDSTYIRAYNGKMVYGSGRFLSETVPSSWLAGQNANNGAYNVNDYSNDSSYNPWMRAKNTHANVKKYFSFGTLGKQFYWIGSTTDRTENGFDQGMSFNVESGLLYAPIVGGDRIYTGYDSGSTGSVSCSNWFRSNGDTGWYNADYECHIRPNTVGSYGSIRVHGNAKGGYEGIHFGSGTNGMTVMSIDGSHQGLYQQSTGTWIIYNNGGGNIGVGTSGLVGGFSVTLGGATYIKGKVVVKGSGSSYNEGIRILPAGNGWSNVFFSADDTTEGTHDGGWLIGRRGAAGTVGAVGDFTIEEENSNGSNLTIHKDSGGATLKGRFSADGGSFGYNNTSYTLSTASFICNSWIRTNNATGWYNETYGGGMYMTDTTYVRVYNDKQFYVSNSGQHAIYTAGGFASANTNGSVLSTYYNGTWYTSIQTHGNGNLSISAPSGGLYLAYNCGNTYFGGGTYCIDRAGYFNGNSATATLPLGFTSHSNNATWGNQTGTTVTCWNEVDGGSVDWRRNNPSSGKVSLKVDGRFYGNEGNNPAMLLTSDGSYWGMGSPDGDASVWIRTTSQGIIPYASKSAGSGTCYLGTSTWYFGYAYIDNIYGSSFSGNAATATAAQNSTFVIGSAIVGYGKPASTYRGSLPESIFAENGVYIAQKGNETSGLHCDGASNTLWGPGDKNLLQIFDEDSTSTTPIFAVNGSGTVTATSFNATSDKRLKTNFRPFAHGDILSLPLYKFDFISSQRKDAIGCLAQDLQQICPEIVHEDKNGYLSIEESKIVYLLIDKMKEMQKEIDTLKEVK